MSIVVLCCGRVLKKRGRYNCRLSRKKERKKSKSRKYVEPTHKNSNEIYSCNNIKQIYWDNIRECDVCVCMR